MKKIFTWLLLFCIVSSPAISSTVPSPGLIIPADKEIPSEIFLKKILSSKIKDLQKLAGRKFSLKEKIAFLVLRKKLNHKSDKTTSKGQTALIFGIGGLVLLVIGLFVPFVLIGSLAASIIAIVVGSSAVKKDPSDSKARSGRLLGWITLGLLVFLTILAVIVVVAFLNSAWW